MSDNWEQVQRDRDRETLRLRVPTGWLYLVNEFGDSPGSIMGQMMAFVPKGGESVGTGRVAPALQPGKARALAAVRAGRNE